MANKASDTDREGAACTPPRWIPSFIHPLLPPRRMPRLPAAHDELHGIEGELRAMFEWLHDRTNQP